MTPRAASSAPPAEEAPPIKAKTAESLKKQKNSESDVEYLIETMTRDVSEYRNR